MNRKLDKPVFGAGRVLLSRNSPPSCSARRCSRGQSPRCLLETAEIFEWALHGRKVVISKTFWARMWITTTASQWMVCVNTDSLTCGKSRRSLTLSEGPSNRICFALKVPGFAWRSFSTSSTSIRKIVRGSTRFLTSERSLSTLQGCLTSGEGDYCLLSVLDGPTHHAQRQR